MGFCLEQGIEKLLLRLACGSLFLGLLTLMAGCSKDSRSVEHTEVSGKVLLQGKPLPGGQVTFVTLNGGFASVGTIDENGNYQINAPLGETAIGVTNQLLQSADEPAAPTQPKTAGAKVRRQKGRWVQIPSRYENPSTSGLKYTVKPGSQTHDIELSTNTKPASAAP